VQEPAALVVLRPQRGTSLSRKTRDALVARTNPLTASVDDVAADRSGPRATAHPIARFEHLNAQSRCLECSRRTESGETSADDRDVNHLSI
jgi:hypothetical protein